MLKKQDIQKLKQKLEERKKELESQLQSFATEDKEVKGDWDTKYPRLDGGAGSQQLEQASDEVEAYVNLLPVEHTLEEQLRDIEQALTKIKKGKYGKCEKCDKPISLRRLQAFPAAKTCSRCKQK